jgi:hypothetical protein
MNTHVYYNVKGLKINKFPQGSHWIEILVDGSKVQQVLDYKHGRFYTFHSSTFFAVPTALQDRVVEVTRKEDFQALSCHKSVIIPGSYSVDNGSFHAEVRDELIQGKVGLVVEVTAKSVATMNKFWPKLLAGELSPKHAYTKRTPTDLLGAGKHVVGGG